jgi:hypothetical protein
MRETHQKQKPAVIAGRLLESETGRAQAVFCRVLMQRAHIYTRFSTPFSTSWTRCVLTFQVRFV